MSLQWRIYYDPREEARAGYTEFTSSQGVPEDAYPHGVIAIVYRGARSKITVVRGNFYYYNRAERVWVGGDQDGILDQFMSFSKDVGALKRGRMIPSDKQWQEVLRRANADTLQ